LCVYGGLRKYGTEFALSRAGGLSFHLAHASFGFRGGLASPSEPWNRIRSGSPQRSNL
jgi:hypothetical protein